jgi:hypothetical protein
MTATDLYQVQTSVKRCYALSSLACCILPSLPCQSTAKPGTFCLVFYALILPAYGVSLVIPCPFVMLYFSLPCAVSLYNTTQSAMHWPVPPTAQPAMHRFVCLSLPFLPGLWPVHHALLRRHITTPSVMHCQVCHALSVHPSLPRLPNKKSLFCCPLPSLPFYACNVE